MMSCRRSLTRGPRRGPLHACCTLLQTDYEVLVDATGCFRAGAPRRVDLGVQRRVVAQLLLRHLERLHALVRSVHQHVAYRDCI